MGGIVAMIANALFSKTVVGALTSTIGGWWENKASQANLRNESNLRIQEAKSSAVIERIKSDTKLYADNDSKAIDSWKYSYIDEVLILSLVILVVCTFVPSMQPYMETGIALLDNYPLWLQVIIGGTYISVLGLRFIFLAPITAIFGKGKR